MFTCTHQITGKRITSISRKWHGREEELRAMGRNDSLICSFCKEPLTFRHGAVKRAHFAHRKASECPLDSHRSAEELEAKVLLFERLEETSGIQVEVDVLLNGETCPIDILVSKNGNPAYAYWFLSQNRREMEKFLHPATSRDIPYFLIYTQSKLLQLRQSLYLQKPQRDNISYHKEFDDFSFTHRGHLNFIDTKTAEISIFRGLRSRHDKQVFDYHVIRRCPVNQLIIQPDGEWLTEGDITYSRERKIQIKKEKEAATKQQRIDQQERKIRIQRQQEADKKRAIFEAEAEKRRVVLEEKSQEKSQRSEDLRRELEYEKIHGRYRLCIYCGNKTDQWSIRKPDGQCVCSPCLHHHNQQQSKISFAFTESEDPSKKVESSVISPHLSQQKPTEKKIYTCELCETQTTDWSSCKPAKNTCICNNCLTDHNRSIEW